MRAGSLYGQRAHRDEDPDPKRLEDEWFRQAALQGERQKQNHDGKVSRLENGLLDLYRKGKHLDKTRENASSPLLRLPPEIRNIIFSYVVEGEFTVEGDFIHHPSEKSRYCYGPVSWVSNREPNRLSILRVCRQIYTETVLLPFSANIFRLRNSVISFQIWLQRRLPVEREAITRIQYFLRTLRGAWLCNSYSMFADSILEQKSSMLPNLEFLHVVICLLNHEGDLTLDQPTVLKINKITKRIEAEIPTFSLTIEWSS